MNLIEFNNNPNIMNDDQAPATPVCNDAFFQPTNSN